MRQVLYKWEAKKTAFMKQIHLEISPLSSPSLDGAPLHLVWMKEWDLDLRDTKSEDLKFLEKLLALNDKAWAGYKTQD